MDHGAVHMSLGYMVDDSRMVPMHACTNIEKFLVFSELQHITM